jgi:putative flippase GtrA
MSTTPLLNRLHLAELFRIARFGLVGVAATGTQALGSLTAAYLQGGHQAKDWLAILIGFPLAFAVSYIGHRYFTFGHGTKSSMFKFLTVALIGLAVAEAVVPFLRAHFGVYLRILVSVMVMPFATYVAAKFWAFKPAPTT